MLDQTAIRSVCAGLLVAQYKSAASVLTLEGKIYCSSLITVNITVRITILMVFCGGSVGGCGFFFYVY